MTATGFFDIRRDGFMRASDLEKATAPLFDAIIERFEAIEKDVKRAHAENEELRGEVKALKAQLETERRLRLAMRK